MNCTDKGDGGGLRSGVEWAGEEKRVHALNRDKSQNGWWLAFMDITQTHSAANGNTKTRPPKVDQ